MNYIWIMIFGLDYDIMTNGRRKKFIKTLQDNNGLNAGYRIIYKKDQGEYSDPAHNEMGILNKNLSV